VRGEELEILRRLPNERFDYLLKKDRMSRGPL
jgi:hypothetical protein